MIDSFKLGEWYVYAGKERGKNWAVDMVFVLDNRPHLCIDGEDRFAHFQDDKQKLKRGWGDLTHWFHVPDWDPDVWDWYGNAEQAGRLIIEKGDEYVKNGSWVPILLAVGSPMNSWAFQGLPRQPIRRRKQVEPPIFATIRALNISPATKEYALKAAQRIIDTGKGDKHSESIINFCAWIEQQEGDNWWYELDRGNDPGVPDQGLECSTGVVAMTYMPFLIFSPRSISAIRATLYGPNQYSEEEKHD